MRKQLSIYLFSVLSFASYSVVAQDDLETIIKGSKADANYLAEGYISPMLKSFGYGLNQGWYNTAKTHKTLGVDLTISVSAVSIPNSDLFYTVDNNRLTQVKLRDTGPGTQPVAVNGSGSVPTIFGPDRRPEYQTYNSTTQQFTNQPFRGPGGMDLKEEIKMQAMPVPIAHLGIGLPKGFDLKLRFVPTIDFNNGKFNLFGVGVMHDVKQYIPGIKNLPFDLSGFVGYTKMKLDVGLDESRPDQKAVLESTATTIQGLISKKLSVVTFYGGLGYNIAKTTMAVRGVYDVDNDNATNDPDDIKDPIDIKAESNGFRTTVGMRLKLAVLTFHGDYTLQKYNTLTVGVGIAVR